MSRSSAKAARLRSSPATPPRRVRRRCCCTPTTTCSRKAIRPVAVAAVRADRARRPALRPRHRRRQGRYRNAFGGVPRPRRQAAGRRDGLRRGGGGVGLAVAVPAAGRASRRAGRRRHRDRRLGQLEHRNPVADGVAARARRLRGGGRHARSRPAFGDVGRRGARRADRCWSGCWPACTTTTATSRWRVCTRAPPPTSSTPPERVRAESGLLDGVREIGSGSVAQRLWAKPAITVIGIDTTPIAKSSNTLIPRARAKVSMRVAPGGDAARAPGRADPASRAARAVGCAGDRHARRRRPAVRDRRHRPGLRRRPRCVPHGVGPRTRRHRGGRLDPVHRRVRRGVPGGEDPGHRRGGSRRRRRTASTRACTWACWNVRRPPRRCCWTEPRASDATGRGVAWRRGRWRVTLYCATAILPFSSTTNVDRITPCTVLPYIFFSPKAPHAVSTSRRDPTAAGRSAFWSSRNLASFAGLSGEMPMTSRPAPLSSAQAVPEVARLLGAARRRRGGVEVHDDLAALVVATA